MHRTDTNRAINATFEQWDPFLVHLLTVMLRNASHHRYRLASREFSLFEKLRCDGWMALIDGEELNWAHEQYREVSRLLNTEH